MPSGRLPPEVRLEREAGRRAFGADPGAYDRARPAYPDEVFDRLVERCGLGPGTATFEVGPGTGLATFALLARGAEPLVVIEPDERLAAWLADRIMREGAAIDLQTASFEDAELAAGSFDLGVSATAFHWIDPAVGLAKVGSLLRPGGWWAMWWNVFGDPERPDPFHDATVRLLGGLSKSPSEGVSWRAPFALDARARIGDLEAAGVFESIEFDRQSRSLFLDAGEIRELYGTFSSINTQRDDDRARLLDAIADVAETEFAGRVERRLVTAMYSARRRV